MKGQNKETKIKEELETTKRCIESVLDIISQFPENWERLFAEINPEVLMTIKDAIEDVTDSECKKLDREDPVQDYIYEACLYSLLISFGIAWGRLHPTEA